MEEEHDESEYGSCPTCGAEGVHVSELGNEGGITCCKHCYQNVRDDQQNEE